MLDQEFICFFTGHRKLPGGKIHHIVKRLNDEVDALIRRGVTNFISGGALGFDQMAASLVLAKREMNPDICLIFALPCKNQDAKWTEKQKIFYRKLLAEADEIRYISEKYDTQCMKRRNTYMAEQSAYCVCAMLYEKSGTGQTVRHAHKKGVQVINILQEG